MNPGLCRIVQKKRTYVSSVWTDVKGEKHKYHAEHVPYRAPNISCQRFAASWGVTGQNDLLPVTL